MGGRLITFEGPEGAGKSTQISLLAHALADRGVDVLVTREPGGTALGEQLRTLLLTREGQPLAASTEALLHTAARAQHVAAVIRPALRSGRVVLCDRFVDSTLAYQGGGRGLPLDALRSMQRLATDGVEPDLCILLDLPVEEGLERRKLGADHFDRMDAESLAFHRRVRAVYHRLVAEDPGRWIVVDASGDVAVVAAAIDEAVTDLLGLTASVGSGAAP